MIENMENVNEIANKINRLTKKELMTIILELTDNVKDLEEALHGRCDVCKHGYYRTALYLWFCDAGKFVEPIPNPLEPKKCLFKFQKKVSNE